MDTDKLVEWIGTLIVQGKLKKFYKSEAWRQLRRATLNDQHNECQTCKSKGIAEIATVAHHIKHVKRHPELALTKSNLMCVCEECHYQIHHTTKHKEQLNIERW